MQSSRSEEAPTREVGEGVNRGGGWPDEGEGDAGGLDRRVGGGLVTDHCLRLIFFEASVMALLRVL